jgi:hypothetical protein
MEGQRKESLAQLISATTVKIKERLAIQKMSRAVPPPDEPPIDCPALLALIEAAQSLYSEECPIL